MVRVLIASDQYLVRGALKALLGTGSGLDIMAEVADDTGTTQKVTGQNVDVTFTDIETPCLDGIDAIVKVSDHCYCLAVTTFARPGYLKRMLQAGASGFLTKDTPPEQLAEAIRCIHSDLRVIDPALAEASLFTADSPLTDREVEIARLVLQGVDMGTIAGQLFIARGAVCNQVSSIVMRTDTSNHVEVAKTTRDSGWLQKTDRNTTLIFVESLLLSQCENSLLLTA